MLYLRLILLMMLINILPTYAAMSDGVSIEYVPSAFNMGIGYISPTAKLHVNGTTATKAFTLNGNTTSVPSLTQGDILFAKVAGTLNRLAKGTNHYALKVNGNKLAWEPASNSAYATNIDGLSDAISDTNNVYLGTGAGENASNLCYNTAAGVNSLRDTTTGHYNIATGYLSLANNTIGQYNAASGSESLYSNIDGDYNTAGGAQSLYSNTTGSNNTASGYQALYYPVTGSGNTAIGSRAGEGTSTYSFSNGTFLGYYAGAALTTGSNNTFLGYNSGSAVTHGNGNVLIGYNAGNGITTGSKNIIIGYDVDAASPTGSNQLNIGDTIYGNTSTGNVGLGTSSPSVRLDVESSAASDGIDINNTAADGDPRIAFQLSGTSTFTMGIDDGDSDKFKIGTSAIDTSTRLTIDSSGNVGIGDTSPGAKLEVTSVILTTPTDSPGTCNSAMKGGMYFDTSMSEPCFCNGTNWRQFDNGGNCT